MNKAVHNILALILLSTFPAIAGNSLHAEENTIADSSSIKIVTIDQEYFETLRQKSDFDYGGEFTKSDLNALNNPLGKLLRKAFELFERHCADVEASYEYLPSTSGLNTKKFIYKLNCWRKVVHSLI